MMVAIFVNTNCKDQTSSENSTCAFSYIQSSRISQIVSDTLSVSRHQSRYLLHIPKSKFLHKHEHYCHFLRHILLDYVLCILFPKQLLRRLYTFGKKNLYNKK